MRIISLNTWGGRALHPLLRFFQRHKDSTDIFCLQEVHDSDQRVHMDRHPDEHIHADGFNKIARELPGHQGLFARFPDDPHRMTNAMFVHNRVLVYYAEHVLIHNPPQSVETGSVILSPRRLQYVVIQWGVREVMVVNYHGLWTPDGKTDTPERLDQSRNVQDFMDSFNMPKILCGDLNLEPDTAALAILERGMRNLVKEGQACSTRTVLYRDYNTPGVSKFADYVLVSPEIVVQDFKVLTEPPDICSDHAALVLDFNI